MQPDLTGTSRSQSANASGVSPRPGFGTFEQHGSATIDCVGNRSTNGVVAVISNHISQHGEHLTLSRLADLPDSQHFASDSSPS